jgi:hypothetical protein
MAASATIKKTAIEAIEAQLVAGYPQPVDISLEGKWQRFIVLRTEKEAIERFDHEAVNGYLSIPDGTIRTSRFIMQRVVLSNKLATELGFQTIEFVMTGF